MALAADGEDENGLQLEKLRLSLIFKSFLHVFK